MSEPPDDAARAARVATFAATAVLSATQDLVRTVLPALGDAADPDVVAEETLALVATATARAVELGLRERPALAHAVAPALGELPFLYHDYLLGAALVAEGAEGEVPVPEASYARLLRKSEFYATQLPAGRFPGAAALAEKLPLWMGRVSPPALPTTPQARLQALGLADALGVHLRLVLAFARRVAEGT